MTTIENASTEELRAALAERERAEQMVRAAEEDRLRRVVEENVGVFLALFPTHGRTSCSDESPTNAGRARCSRCLLLHVQHHGYMPDDVIVETSLLFNFVTN